MDTSLDTKKNKKQKKKQLWVPDTLRGKKVKKMQSPSNNELASENLMEQYLETGEMGYFFMALKKDSSLYKDVVYEIDLKAEEVKRKRSPNYKSRTDSIYVDRLCIVSEVIRTLRDKCVFRLGEVVRTPQGRVIGYTIDKEVTEKVTKEAKRYLKRISSLLVPERKARYEQDTRDGLTHVDPYQMKGTHPFLRHQSYHSAFEFIKEWDRVEEAFETKKKRYNKPTRPLLKKVHSQYPRQLALLYGIHKEEDPKISDIKKIIENKLGDKISEREVKRFNLEDISTITASYLAWKHEQVCSRCKDKKSKKVAYKTFLRLYQKALEETK